MPRDERPELTAGRLALASPSHRQTLAIALDILENARGCNAPFETLVETLIEGYRYDPDPEFVDMHVAEFHVTFAEMRADAEAFVKRYPKLFRMETKTAPEGVSRTRGAVLEDEVKANIRSSGPVPMFPSAYQNSPAVEPLA